MTPMKFEFETRQHIIDWCKENLSREERYLIARTKAPEDKRYRRIYVFDADRKPIGNYRTATMAAKELGIPHGTIIGAYIERRSIYKQKYFFSFTPELADDVRGHRKPYGIQ
jgi:predicted amidohydrolase